MNEGGRGMIVMKFGGTLMGAAPAVRRSASLVADELGRGTRVVVTVSAMVNVTDALLGLAARAEKGDLDGALEVVAELRARHLGTAAELGALPAEGASREIGALCDLLRETVTGVGLLRELSPRSRDLIVSFGERLSAPLMEIALEALGVRAHHLSGGEAGIVTDRTFGNARPLQGAYDRIRERIGGLLGLGITPVVAGFIGQTPEHVITTLGRGGTDYTATILGAALGAGEVWTWKDVDGVMSADPRMVPEARTLSHLSYAEVMELAYFGAKVLHPLAVTPLQESGLPLRVKSAADPAFPGTLVTAQSDPEDGVHPVKAVTAIRGLAIVTVSGGGMVGVPDVVSEIFQVVAREEATVHLISQGNSQANVSLVVTGPHALPLQGALERALESTGRVRDVLVQEGIAVVAVVGEGMRGHRGVAARLFTALAEAGVNILMIAQGSSELNISLAIEEQGVEAAVRAAHAAFALGGALHPV